MGIGASVFMVALGAIITFAFNVRVGWLDLDIVGWVLMAAGAFGLVFALLSMNRRRTAVVTHQTSDGRIVDQVERTDVDRPL
jgi:hypothetical protein